MDNETYRKAILKWGIDDQTRMVIEELSELNIEIATLIQNILHIKRRRTTNKKIASEVADVIIMLEQLKIMLNIEDDVNEHIELKTERLKRRIEDL